MSRALALGLVACGLLGCGRSEEMAPTVDAEPADTPVPVGALPDAFLVRFEEVTGTGFSRESWEIEVLQMGGVVRVRGSIRTGGSSVPLFDRMSRPEFLEFWGWIRKFPLDGFRVREDAEAPAQDWRKKLKFDAVLSSDKRVLSENTWTRPPVDVPWLREIEDRLHLMALDLAEQELRRAETEVAKPSAPDEANQAMQRALEALGDAEPRNIPGGSPDAD